MDDHVDVVVELVLDDGLAPGGDEEDLLQVGGHHLLHDVLYGRVPADRKHLLGQRLGGWQQTRSQPGNRYDDLMQWHFRSSEYLPNRGETGRKIQVGSYVVNVESGPAQIQETLCLTRRYWIDLDACEQLGVRSQESGSRIQGSQEQRQEAGVGIQGNQEQRQESGKSRAEAEGRRAKKHWKLRIEKSGADGLQKTGAGDQHPVTMSQQT